MKLKELTVSVSRKINLGNYESKGILIGATVMLEESDDMLEAKQELTNRLNQFLEFEVKRIRNNGSGQKTAAPSPEEFFGEVIDSYPLEQAIEDGFLVKVGEFANGKPIVFTMNLFEEVKDNYKEIVKKGIELLKKLDPEDTECMRLRVIEKGRIWIVLDGNGCTFMKPVDY